MKIESRSAQIEVRDNDGFAGVNINSTLSGFAADMCFWGGAAYLCTRKDDLSFVHVVVLPGTKWLQDLKDEGYEVIALLSDLAKASKGAQSTQDRSPTDSKAGESLTNP